MTHEEAKKIEENNQKLTNLDLLNEVKFHKSRDRYKSIKKFSKFSNTKLKPL